MASKQDFSVELKLLLTLDKAAQDRIKKGVSTLAQELEKNNPDLTPRISTSEVTKETQKITKALKEVEDQAKKTDAAVKKVGRNKKTTGTVTESGARVVDQFGRPVNVSANIPRVNFGNESAKPAVVKELEEIKQEAEEATTKVAALKRAWDSIPQANKEKAAAIRASLTSEKPMEVSDKDLKAQVDARKRVGEAGKKAEEEYELALRNSENAMKSFDQIADEVIKKHKKGGEEGVDSEREKSKAIHATIKDMRLEARELMIGASVAMRESARIQQASQTLIVAGTALSAGILAEGNRYASSAKKPTEATEAWTRATNDLAQARTRADEVIIKQSLPIMREVAKIANVTAGFIERNPQIVPLALKAGVILAGIGGIGMLVAKGLRVYADIQYLAATNLQLAAAKLQKDAGKDQLKAAVINSKSKGAGGGLFSKEGLTKGLAGAGLLTEAGGATALGAALAAGLGVAIGAGINDVLTKLTGKGAYTNQFLTVGARQVGHSVFEKVAEKRGMSVEEAQRKTLVFTALIGKLTGAVDENSDLWKKAAASIKGASATVSEGIAQLAGSPHEVEIVNAYTKWQADDAKLVKDAMNERIKIIAEGEKDVADITRKYADQRVNINKQFNDNRASIVTSYAAAVLEAEQQYNDQRAEIIRSANDDIKKMEEDYQESRRKAELDHADTMDELARNLDALGLVKEERRFAREKSEADRAQNLEIKRHNKEIAQRLQDLNDQFQAERAKRLEQYKQDLTDNEKKRTEELKRNAEELKAELKQQHEAQVAKLKELQDGLNAERKRRQDVFIAEVRDLDAYLLGDRGQKQNYYNLMLADADRFLAAYRAKLPTGATGTTSGQTGTVKGTADAGGYVNKGLYRMAWDGKSEWVANATTTRALERAIGSSLTQSNVTNALNGGSRQVVYQDQRRMEIPLSKDQAEMYEQGALDALKKITSTYG